MSAKEKKEKQSSDPHFEVFSSMLKPPSFRSPSDKVFDSRAEISRRPS